MRRFALLALLALACSTAGELAAPREQYNDGLRALAEQDWEAAQRDLLAARDQAGADVELRFRAACALALALAGEADRLAADQPEEALARLRSAARWLADAVDMRPDDAEVRQDLEVLLRRAQALADRINQGQNGLAARLDRLIEDQRGLRDGVRRLMTRVDAAGAAAEPRAFQSDHDRLSTDERTLVGEAGAVLDLAGDEIGTIDGKPEDQRSPEEQARLVQLRNLEHWVGAARADLADARLALRRLQGDRAHRRADAGLANLVRAREQLEDPVKVLQGLAEEEAMLLVHTGALAQLAAGKPLLGDGDPAGAPAPPVKAPPWLTTVHLGERQTQLEERAAELVARLEAGVARGGQPQAPGAAADPRMTQILAQAGEAVPHARQATAAMKEAATALAGERVDDAVEREQEAMRALVAAIERFADLRTLVELTWADQQRLLALLDPDDAEARKVKPDERQRQVAEAVGKNQDRLGRMKALIATELATLEQQQAAAGQQGGQAAADPQALAAERTRYQQAEELRARALAEVDALAAIAGGKAAGSALERARNAHLHLEELRRLFFTLVEHLKRLHADQAQTHDRTATAQRADDDGKRAEQIGPLVDFQQRHAELGASLAGALEAQADAAAQQGGGDPQAQEMAQRLQQAAPEVRAAATAITSAAGLLGTARDQAGSMSIDLEPTLEQQKQALAHLEEALRILEPPPPQQPQDDQDQQQQQEQVSQQEAERRLQEIREREAERERDKRERQQRPPEPVEKDW